MCGFVPYPLSNDGHGSGPVVNLNVVALSPTSAPEDRRAAQGVLSVADQP